MAVPFFWRTTGEKQTEQLISEFEQTLEDDYEEETDVEEEQTSISKEDEAILKEGGVIGIIEIPGLDIRYKLYLNVYQKNARAISFYKREGFEIQHSGLDEATGEKRLCNDMATQIEIQVCQLAL